MTHNITSVNATCPLKSDSQYIPTTIDIVLWSMCIVLFVIYHVFYFIQFKRNKKLTNLGINLETRKRMAKKLLSFEGGSIIGIQALRNSINAAVFYAGTSSTVGFILLKMALGSTGLLWVQQATLVGILFFGFANWLTVIKSFDHGTSLFASEEMPKVPTEDDIEIREMHIKLTTHILQKGQIYYFIGMRAWYASMMCAVWFITSQYSVSTLLVCIVVIIWMYFQDHQFQEHQIKLRKVKEEKRVDTEVPLESDT